MNYGLEQMDLTIYYLLLLYAFCSTLSIAAGNIAISLACLVAVIRYCRQSVHIKIEPGLLKAIAIFLGAMLLSGVFGHSFIAGITKVWGTLYRMVPLLLVVMFVKTEKKLLNLLIGLGVSVSISDIYTILQGFQGDPRPMAFTSYMIFAGCLIQLIPLFLALGTRNDVVKSTAIKKLFIAFFAISIPALVYNSTRAAWIAAGVAIIIFACLNVNKNKKLFISLLAFIILFSIFSMSLPALRERIHSITDLQYQSNAEHLLLWQSAWNMFSDHKLLGIGAGSFKVLYNTQYILPQAKEPGLGHAHSNFMHILAEMGIVGLASFMYLFGYILVTSYKKYRANQHCVFMVALFVITISLLTQGLTETNFDDSLVIRLYWFIVGLTYAGYNLDWQQVARMKFNS